MISDDQKRYNEIITLYKRSQCSKAIPQKEERYFKKCSILENVNIGYSNMTTVDRLS